MESKIIEYALCRYDAFKLKIIALHKLNVDHRNNLRSSLLFTYITHKI